MPTLIHYTIGFDTTQGKIKPNNAEVVSPTIGKVRTQLAKTDLKTIQSTPFLKDRESAIPTPMTAPTEACVVLIGNSKRVAKRITKVALRLAQKAFEGRIDVTFSPIVIMTCFPNTDNPIQIPTAATKNTQSGHSDFLEITCSFAASTAAKGPTEFATSFPPWAID